MSLDEALALNALVAGKKPERAVADAVAGYSGTGRVQTCPVIPFAAARKPYLATTQVPRNANTVTKTAVGMVELVPSLLLNLASAPRSR